MYDIPYLALSDSSVNGTYQTCNHKFELRKLYDHDKSDRQETIATGAGHALHKAYQTYLQTNDKNQGAAALMFEFPSDLQRSPNDVRSLEACYSSYLEMLANPLDGQYKLASILVDNEERPAIEVPFRITFKDLSLLKDKNIPIYWDGYIDAILWDTVKQEYVVVDIKTTRKSRYDYTEMFKRDPQCLPYAYVLERVLGQPATALRVIYFVVYIDAMTPVANQYPVYKTEEDIKEWAFTAAMDINAIRTFAQLGFFPRRGKSCDVYNVCEYAEVCDYNDPQAIRNWLDLAYGKPDFDNRAKEFQPWFELSLTIEGLQ